MGWLEFIASLVGHIAWPAVVVVSVLLLRKPVMALLPDLQKLKVKDIEVEFGRKLEEAKAEVDQLPEVQLPVEEPRIRFEVNPDMGPSLAVLQAWKTVEIELFTLAEAAGVAGKGPTGGVVRALRAENLIDNATARALDDLRQLRNLAAHSNGSRSVSDSQALEYIETAATLAEHLRWVRSRLAV